MPLSKTVLLLIIIIITLISCVLVVNAAVDWTSVPATSPPATPLDTTSLGSCICDLTGNACDPNCCCDKECSPGQLASFTRCRRAVVSQPHIRRCSDPVPDALKVLRTTQEDDDALHGTTVEAEQSVLLKEKLDERPNPFEGLVCLYRSGGDVLDGSYFDVPASVGAEDYDAALEKKDMRGIQVTTTGGASEPSTSSNSGVTFTTRKRYFVGDAVGAVKVRFTANVVTIDTRNEGAAYPLPRNGLGGICGPSNAASWARFMVSEEDVACDRYGTLEEVCLRDLSIDHLSGFALAPKPGNISVHTLVDVPATVVQADTGAVHGVLSVEHILVHSMLRTASRGMHALADDNVTYPPLPPRVALETQYVVDGANQVAVCRNAVVRMSSLIVYSAAEDAGTSILSATATLHVRDITIPLSRLGSKQRWAQTYSVAFKENTRSGQTTTRREGNPGYLRSVPVLAGLRQVEAGTSKVAIDVMPKGLMLPSGGRCDGDAAMMTARPLRFNEDVRSSACYLRLTAPELESMCASYDGAYNLFIKNVSTFAASFIASAAERRLHLGRLATSVFSHPTDWVPVENAHAEYFHQQLLAKGSPLPYDRYARECKTVFGGVALTILTAKAGATYNPQDVVVGARLEPIYLPSVRFQNVSSADSWRAGGTTKVYFHFRVVYARYVEQSSSAAEVELPSLMPEVDRELFYPFVISPHKPDEDADAYEASSVAAPSGAAGNV
eukprot:PhM_4_TR14374/c0_g2_i1/m.98103/K19382/TCTN1_3; tectonic-1/3